MSTFAAGMQKWAKKTGLSIDRAVVAATVDISSEIISRTPVDTGRLRGNWIPSTGAAQVSELDRTEPDLAGVKAEADKAVGGVYFLVNSLPYARRIEYEGWSSVKAPQGMVRVSVQNWRATLQEAIR